MVRLNFKIDLGSLHVSPGIEFLFYIEWEDWELLTYLLDFLHQILDTLNLDPVCEMSYTEDWCSLLRKLFIFRVTIPTTVTLSSTMATVQKMTFTAAVKTSQDTKHHLKTFQNKMTTQQMTIQQMKKTVLQVTNRVKDWPKVLFTKTIIATLVSSTW